MCELHLIGALWLLQKDLICIIKQVQLLLPLWRSPSPLNEEDSVVGGVSQGPALSEVNCVRNFYLSYTTFMETGPVAFFTQEVEATDGQRLYAVLKLGEEYGGGSLDVVVVLKVELDVQEAELFVKGLHNF